MVPSPKLSPILLPANFWTIRPDVDMTIHYCRTLTTRGTEPLVTDLTSVYAFSSLKKERCPILCEVFDRQFILNMYFDLDKAWDGMPSEAECKRVLEAALNFLRPIIRSRYSIRSLTIMPSRTKVSFHIVCPQVRSPRHIMHLIVKASEHLDLGLDPAVYNCHRQTLLPVFAMEEKNTIRHTRPVEPYVGISLRSHCPSSFPDLHLDSKILPRFRSRFQALMFHLGCKKKIYLQL